mgnify:CR=1 FL=1
METTVPATVRETVEAVKRLREHASPRHVPARIVHDVNGEWEGPERVFYALVI